MSFYLIGLPLAALLGFRSRYGFAGFWMGLEAAQISCMRFMVSTLVCTNWTDQASRAKVLIQDTKGCNNDLEVGNQYSSLIYPP